MLCENNLSKYFWEKVINTTRYVINRVSIRPLLSKTFYELYKSWKPNISHLRSFGCKYFVLNNGKHFIGKMDTKSDGAFFMGYALNSKVYRVFNKSLLIVEESIHIVFDETNVVSRKVVVVVVVDDDDVDIEDSKVKEPKEKELEESKDEPPLKDLQRIKDQHKDLPRRGSSFEIIHWIKLLGILLKV